MESIHAEHDCLNKTVKNDNHKQTIKNNDALDMLVIKMSKGGILSYSRPCKNCLIRMSKSKYPLNNIYYSVDPDTIACEKFSDMLKDLANTRMSRGDRSNVGQSPSQCNNSTNNSTNSTKQMRRKPCITS